MDSDAVSAVVEAVADAVHEVVLGAGTFDLRLCEDDDPFALGDGGGHFT